jgi:hypothetical protein
VVDENLQLNLLKIYDQQRVAATEYDRLVRNSTMPDRLRHDIRMYDDVATSNTRPEARAAAQRVAEWLRHQQGANMPEDPSDLDDTVMTVAIPDAEHQLVSYVVTDHGNMGKRAKCLSCGTVLAVLISELQGQMREHAKLHRQPVATFHSERLVDPASGEPLAPEVQATVLGFPVVESTDVEPGRAYLVNPAQVIQFPTGAGEAGDFLAPSWPPSPRPNYIEARDIEAGDWIGLELPCWVRVSKVTPDPERKRLIVEFGPAHTVEDFGARTMKPSTHVRLDPSRSDQ